jgi:cation:H+ antiporter
MSIWQLLLQVVLLVLGFVMLIKGADWFVDGAASLAGKFGIPQLVIGLTIVAMGTSAPEAAVSISAALQDNAGITIGNVVGSNILNVFVILGLASVIIPIAVKKSTIKYEIPFTILVTGVLAVLGLWDNKISTLEGVILWGLFILYLGYLFWMTKKGEAEVEESESKLDKIWKMIVFILIGGGLIVWGSDVTVDAATSIAKFFNMSDQLIGLTIVALGTSLPELITSVTAAKKGNADIAIGNIVGSNLFNILFVVGTTALITPVVYAQSFLVDSIVAVVSMVLLLLLVLNKDKKLKRWGGAILLVGYAAYFAYLMMFTL